MEAVQAGTHMMFLGGWLSFNGKQGKGGWGRTGLASILQWRGEDSPAISVGQFHMATPQLTLLPLPALRGSALL